MEKIILIFYLTPKKKHNTMWMNIKQPSLVKVKLFLPKRISFAPQPQSSMVIIDQHTGYVKALVGGRGEKTASLTLNRATDTYRQPGSTFKTAGCLRTCYQ
mgnify:CR=1 FL=1